MKTAYITQRIVTVITNACLVVLLAGFLELAHKGAKDPLAWNVYWGQMMWNNVQGLSSYDIVTNSMLMSMSRYLRHNKQGHPHGHML